MSANQKQASAALVILAFAIVYIVWGSTYFFIQRALVGFSPLILGAFRFLIAGILLLTWCLIRKEKIINPKQILYSSITGLLLLFIGTGGVIIAETSLPSSLVGVIITSEVVWLVLFDKAKWKENFSNKGTIPGLALGLAGVFLLFAERIGNAEAHATQSSPWWIYLILIFATMSWAGGSVFSKNRSFGSSSVNASWQMIAAGIAFLISGGIKGEWKTFHWEAVPVDAWLSMLYLVFMGSLAAFSAYVWLLKVRPITQVSTHLYVNPVVAVLLGVFFAGEAMSRWQIAGLAFILVSVLLINLTQYRKTKQVTGQKPLKNNNPAAIRTNTECLSS